MPSKHAKKTSDTVDTNLVETPPSKENKKTKEVKEVKEVKDSNSVQSGSSKKVDTKSRKKETTTNTTGKTVTNTASVVTNEPVDNTSVAENVVIAGDTTDTITENFTEFIAKFQTMLTQFNALKTELKTLERKTVKQLKVVQKLNNKKRRKGTRAPSGFVKPSLISDELASFLGRDKGSEMARTDVTREINKYIRANNLQDKENGRKINADHQLKELLKIDDTVALTYFNLQRYMGPHFPKQSKTVSSTTQ